MEFILKFLFLTSFTYNFSLPFLFLSYLSFSQCSPQSSNPTAATTVKRLELLPGMTILFRDLQEAYPWFL